MPTKYVKFISPTEILYASESDFDHDGKLHYPDQWSILVDSPEPEPTPFDKFSKRYEQQGNQVFVLWDRKHVEPEGKVGKLDGDKIRFPKSTETIEGSKVLNFDKLPNSMKMGQGWFLVVEDPLPSDGKPYEAYGEFESHPEFGQVIRQKWRPLPELPVIPDEREERIEALREKYRQSTRTLCSLAEVEPKDKLEDVEYEQVASAASMKNPAEAFLLTQTIMYCFFQLKLEDGIDAWIRI
jgi:hypothetical protein